MPIARCPHCGLNVLFQADRVCPSCHVHLDEPVTDRDLVRIAQIARPRPLRSVAAVGGYSAAGTVGVVIVYKLIFVLLRFLEQFAPP